MKRVAIAFVIVLAGLLLAGCSAKKTDQNGKTLLGGKLEFNAVETGHGDGKSLDIDAGVTVMGSEFGFVTSGNGSYIKGVKGMDPTMEGHIPREQPYDPMQDPEPPAPGEAAPQASQPSDGPAPR